MPRQYPFSKGDYVQVDGEEGYINCISPHYFTLTTHQWEAPGTLHGVRQVNVLVYRHLWPNIIFISKHHVDSDEHDSDQGM